MILILSRQFSESVTIVFLKIYRCRVELSLASRHWQLGFDRDRASSRKNFKFASSESTDLSSTYIWNALRSLGMG